MAEVGSLAAWKGDQSALVHALEWAAKHCGGAVVALVTEMPTFAPPFDRILYNARTVVDVAPCGGDGNRSTVTAEPWIGPWRGAPHPLSDIEKRLAKALVADPELGHLFGFNQTIVTVRGSRPKVDLLWCEGRLVIEIDGFDNHGTRRAFRDDRHRDYELMASGYIVLRLPNEEIAQDCGRAVEKIRDLGPVVS